MAASITVASVDAFAPQCDLAARDPGDVHQVFDEPREVRDLTMDDVPCPSRVVVSRVRRAENLLGAADRRQRVAKLVGERGQKLVLAPVGLRLLGKVGADLVLARSRAQGGENPRDERRDPRGPLEDRDVAESLDRVHDRG